MSTTTLPFVGQVRMEWYQSLDQLNFTFYVKDRQPDDVTVHKTSTTLEVTIRLDSSGRDYSCSYDPLFAELKDDAPTVSVRPMKVEVSVKKTQPYQWPTLERQGDVGAVAATAAAESAPAPVSDQPTTAKDLKYPNSKGKDWSSVKLEDDDDTKPEGEAALNQLFQQIYGGGTDEQRRAMIKSFTESGGTVLSTNWDDVKKTTVSAQPPKGMEAKSLTE
ncbi:Phosphatase-like protein [Leptomonas seymouri]|uniref:Phosphatase-like protein n=1 Tax=Leptomonas seymouri TaxID=5684 RepID=A0A0N1HVR6_LEPSE|nr:Phosphatase-like protein [Leptomonas seymouri]|eukprot:KPI84745.1 Phosphatase-like protein [Leptomonas seymouri]